jgi:hypothetical protein
MAPIDTRLKKIGDIVLHDSVIFNHFKQTVSERSSWEKKIKQNIPKEHLELLILTFLFNDIIFW